MRNHVVSRKCESGANDCLKWMTVLSIECNVIAMFRGGQNQWTFYGSRHGSCAVQGFKLRPSGVLTFLTRLEKPDRNWGQADLPGSVRWSRRSMVTRIELRKHRNYQKDCTSTHLTAGRKCFAVWLKHNSMHSTRDILLKLGKRHGEPGNGFKFIQCIFFTKKANLQTTFSPIIAVFTHFPMTLSTGSGQNLFH
jgi:hypothetical protein